eukprot:jgi/Galph1/3526/GphlegSOOS_G2192.1
MESTLQLLVSRCRLLTSSCIFSNRLELCIESRRLLIPKILKSDPYASFFQSRRYPNSQFSRASLRPRLFLRTSGTVKDSSISSDFLKQKPSTVSDWNVANGITCTRIASIPFIAGLVSIEQYHLATVGLVAAGATDLLDGFIARRCHMSTVLGSYLDPLADKLLINTLVLTLALNHLLPLYLAVIICCRDGLLISGAAIKRWEAMKHQFSFDKFLKVSNVEPLKVQPLFISKVNTAAQLVLVGYCILQGAEPEIGNDNVFYGLVIITTLTTVISGGAYIYYGLLSKKGNVFQNVQVFTSKQHQNMKCL